MISPSEIILSPLSGASRRYPATWGGLRYNDPFARLYYVDGGSGAIRHHDRTFKLKKGGIYLIPSNTRSDYRCHPHLDLYWIHFTAHVFGGVSLFSLIEPAFELSEKEIPYARDFFERLVADPTTTDPALKLEMDGIIRMFLGRFYSGSSEVMSTSKLKRLESMRPVLTYIDSHLDQPVTLAELAAIVHLHPHYFSNLFKKIMHVPPLTYVVQRRIEKAQHLLWLTDEPVKSVAWQVGYEDEFYFSRVFKKTTGVSPSRYREQRRMGAR